MSLNEAIGAPKPIGNFFFASWAEVNGEPLEMISKPAELADLALIRKMSFWVLKSVRLEIMTRSRKLFFVVWV